MSSWKIASSYIIGQGHISKNIPCQDRTFKLIKKHSSGTFYGLALADGAGSCSHSDIGAEFIVKKILNFIKSKFLYIYKKNNPSQYIIKYIEKELYEFSNKKNINFKDLSSTLLFIAIKNNKFIIGHIGDGVIGMLDNKNILKTISKPDNGEFSNSTFFTTSIKYKER
ncbi:MAG: protein phosphatase 2C domain-containing protein, partial [Sulfurovaceae bacterium]|nr:protein phosphatase 2C domain-containing protein [Sulfurovaceae bacterium]